MVDEIEKRMISDGYDRIVYLLDLAADDNM